MSAHRLNKSIDERTVGQLLTLLGKTESDKTPHPSQLPAPRPGELPPMIRAYDRYARELGIPRESWKNAVLEPAFRQNASDPEALHRLIVQALEDGFIEESLPPAQQLVKIDPNPLRAASLLGSVFLQLKHFDEALEVLEAAVQEHEDGNVLVQIAKAYAGRGDAAKSEEILSRALKLDPNQKEGLEWYAAIGMERDGKSGQLAAYRHIATLPASWLAQLKLANAALENQDLDGALSFYKHILQKIPDIPEDVLLKISGDVSRHGSPRQMLEVFEPSFNAAKHGLALGADLIAAHIELNDLLAARRILDMLYALQRPDWNEHLLYWGKRIDDADHGPMKHPKPLAFEFLRLGNPIWASGDPDIEGLLPAKAPDASRIVLVCGSGSFGASPPAPSGAKAMDDLGRLTRFVPMFFAEELQLRTEMRSIFLLSRFTTGGFFVNAHPWQRKQLKIEELNASFVLVMHVDAHRKPWRLQFSLLAGADEIILDRWEQPVDIGNPASAVAAGLERVMQSLFLPDRRAVAEDLVAPEGARLASYLTALEQALAVSNNTEFSTGTSRAEQLVFDNLLQLAVDTPSNARTRCLLVSSLHRSALRQPGIVREYWPKLQQLQSEHPLQVGPAWVAVAVSIERLGARLKLC